MYDVSTARFALRILRNPKIDIDTPVTCDHLIEQKADFVILRKDDRALFANDQKISQGFWYTWIHFSKKHPTGYVEKKWTKEVIKEDAEKVQTLMTMANDLKAVPLAHCYFDSQEELESWFGESNWADLVMKLII